MNFSFVMQFQWNKSHLFFCLPGNIRINSIKIRSLIPLSWDFLCTTLEHLLSSTLYIVWTFMLWFCGIYLRNSSYLFVVMKHFCSVFLKMDRRKKCLWQDYNLGFSAFIDTLRNSWQTWIFSREKYTVTKLYMRIMGIHYF